MRLFVGVVLLALVAWPERHVFIGKSFYSERSIPTEYPLGPLARSQSWAARLRSVRRPWIEPPRDRLILIPGSREDVIYTYARDCEPRLLLDIVRDVIDG